MKVTFEFFGVLERLAGAPALELQLPEGGLSVDDALAELAQRLPDLQEHLSRCACAVGDAMVLRHQRLVPGTHLALLPPVAGG